jgi:hypothetical protein
MKYTSGDAFQTSLAPPATNDGVNDAVDDAVPEI